MTVTSYLTQRFGVMPDPDTELADIPYFDTIDRQTLALAIDEGRPVGAPSVTDHELESWITVGDVLACEAKYEREEA